MSNDKWCGFFIYYKIQFLFIVKYNLSVSKFLMHTVTYLEEKKLLDNKLAKLQPMWV